MMCLCLSTRNSYLLLSKMNTVKDIPKLAAYSALLGLLLNCFLNFVLGQVYGFSGIVYSWTPSCILATGALSFLTLRKQTASVRYRAGLV